tara:strand:- start:79 stop:345 length:267 start_codon:yes stop_codon:yes gene_type:complete
MAKKPTTEFVIMEVNVIILDLFLDHAPGATKLAVTNKMFFYQASISVSIFKKARKSGLFMIPVQLKMGGGRLVRIQIAFKSVISSAIG